MPRMTAPTVDTPQGDEALFARILDLRHWTSNTAGADKRHDCKCEDCKAIKQVVHLARQAVATSQSKRAKQLAEMESALLAARDPLLDAIERGEWAVSPQVGGGWVIEQTFPVDISGDASPREIARTRGSLREALRTALAATPEEK